MPQDDRIEARTQSLRDVEPISRNPKLPRVSLTASRQRFASAIPIAGLGMGKKNLPHRRRGADPIDPTARDRGPAVASSVRPTPTSTRRPRDGRCVRKCRIGARPYQSTRAGRKRRWTRTLQPCPRTILADFGARAPCNPYLPVPRQAFGTSREDAGFIASSSSTAACGVLVASGRPPGIRWPGRRLFVSADDLLNHRRCDLQASNHTPYHLTST